MKRGLFNCLSALALLLCVSAVGMWVRSYFTADLLTVRSQGAFKAASGDGGVSLEFLRFVLRTGNWRHPELGSVETADDYARFMQSPPAGLPRAGLSASGWEWKTGRNHSSQEKIGRIWLRVEPVDRGVADIYDNVNGGQRAWRLVGRQVWIPYWLIVVTSGLFAVFCLGILRRLRGESRRRRNLCPACGYDLRATPDRCPECGTSAMAGSGAKGTP